MGSLHLRNQVTTQEKKIIDLTSINAQLQKSLSQVRMYETELEAENGLLRAQLLVVSAKETTLQSSLDSLQSHLMRRGK